MSDDPKTYSAILVDATKRYGMSGVATAALALSITALATRPDDPNMMRAPGTLVIPTDSTADPTVVTSATAPAHVSGKRLELTTDVDVSPGSQITATGKVELGARLIVIEGCVGHYDEATRVCVLSPGPWELHSSCSEAPPVPDTTCEVSVRNAGTVPLKFSGYVEAAP